jgi:hypothetical protein
LAFLQNQGSNVVAVAGGPHQGLGIRVVRLRIPLRSLAVSSLVILLPTPSRTIPSDEINPSFLPHTIDPSQPGDSVSGFDPKFRGLVDATCQEAARVAEDPIQPGRKPTRRPEPPAARTGEYSTLVDFVVPGVIHGES